MENDSFNTKLQAVKDLIREIQEMLDKLEIEVYDMEEEEDEEEFRNV